MSKWFKKGKPSPPGSTATEQQQQQQPSSSQSNGALNEVESSQPAAAQTPPASRDGGKDGRDSEQWRSLEHLEEELEKIANEPPVVARSIPKGLHLERIGDNSRIAAMQRERSLRHCLYGPEVYDHMLEDTMNVCSLLQDNLDDYITQVRGNTPPDRQGTPVAPATTAPGGATPGATAPVPAAAPQAEAKPPKPKKTAWFATNKNKQQQQQPTLVSTTS